MLKQKCKVCEENGNKKIKSIKIIVEYENPNAQGYPDVCFWEEKYTTKQCPVCKRKILEDIDVK